MLSWLLQIAANFIQLARGSSLAVRTSLEEVLNLLVKDGQVPRSVVRCLWQLVEDTPAAGNIAGYVAVSGLGFWLLCNPGVSL